MGFTHRNHEYNRFGNILFMPTVGLIRTTPVNEFNRKEDYSSYKDFKSEKASAGYYTVFLTDCGVKVELTATRNCGFHRYTFPKSNQANIQIDLAIAAEMEKWQMAEINGNYTVKLVPQPPPVQNAGIQILDNRRIAGWQLPNNSDTVFFYAEFSKPFVSSGTWENDLVKANSVLGNGYPIGGYVTFTTSENEEILVKVGVSSYGIDDARTKLKQEIPGMDFDVTRKETGQKWDNILTKIEVTGSNKDDLVNFYTSLYRTYEGGFSLGWPCPIAIGIFLRGSKWVEDWLNNRSFTGRSGFWGPGEASGVMGILCKGFQELRC